MPATQRPGRGPRLLPPVLAAVLLAAPLPGAGYLDAVAYHGEGIRPGVSAPPAGPPYDCNLGFIPVKPTVGVGSIIGNAWARCDVVPPEVHVFTLSLERRDKGGWTTMATNPPDPRIPAPRLVYEIKTPCVPGVWRATATARGSLFGNEFEFTDHSIERFVTAQDCARGK